MNGLALTLPGGVERNGTVFRDAVLAPLNGYLERAISEELAAADNLPKGVSSVLTVALQSIGGVEVDLETVTTLSVADRQYIMMRLAQMVDGDILWLRGCCTHCSAFFDISLNRSTLPVREAGASYPRVKLECAGYDIELRVPTGGDQASIAELEDNVALQALLRACFIHIEPEVSVEHFIKELNADDIEGIESALEITSPAVCTNIVTHCPECNTEQVLYFDPYGIEVLETEALYSQIHTLAYYYHWSESDILKLPRSRRHRYLHYIDTTRGVYS